MPCAMKKYENWVGKRKRHTRQLPWSDVVVRVAEKSFAIEVLRDLNIRIVLGQNLRPWAVAPLDGYNVRGSVFLVSL